MDTRTHGKCCFLGWNMKNIVTLALITAFFILMLSGCLKGNNREMSTSAVMMDTVINVTLYGGGDRNVLNGCIALCEKYDKIFSRTREDSELYRVNAELSQSGKAYASEELCTLIQNAVNIGDLSDGAFDITIGAVSSLWDFTATEPRLPADKNIKDALGKVSYLNVSVADNRITAKKGTMLDLGAIAKGYVADRLKDYLISNGVSHAIINLGGNVLCVGGNADGELFHIGIRKPFSQYDEISAILEIDDQSAVTSGAYERYFILDGITYHHILDPKTGYPAASDIQSVTIISKQSELGDALSTTCFVLGLDKAVKLIESMEGVYAMFIDDKGGIISSNGFEEAVNVSFR